VDSEHFLDARGLACPLPLLKAKQKLNQMQPGERLAVVATDPGSMRDFASFIKLTSHELLENYQEDDTYYYVIRRGS
jgi:tRNA 2-thiouridine synthesizing protein A